MNYAPNMDTKEFHDVHGKWPKPKDIDTWHWKISFVPEILVFHGTYADSRKACYDKIKEAQQMFDMPVSAELQP